MPSLLILHPPDLGGENHGVLVQHVTSLAELLGRRGWSVGATDLLDPALAARTLAADVVLLQALSDSPVEGIVRARAERGRPTVFEMVDNFLGITAWADEAHPLRSPLARQALLHHASICDALQVYAPGLADLFAGVNPRVIRFDPYVPIPARLPEKPGGFVLGWGGTSSHAVDLAAVAPAIVSFCRRNQDVTFAFKGDRALFDAHFRALPEHQLALSDFGPHEDYLRFVDGLHVGLAPLRQTPFNATRTDTRFGTYAAYGVAAVLENGPVYGAHRDRARLFSTTDELEAILEQMYSDREGVAQLAARARAWAEATRGAEALAAQRDGAYRALLPDGEHAGAVESFAAPDVEPLKDRLAAAARLDASAALQVCEELLAVRPVYEQAQLLFAQSLHRLGRDEEAITYIDALAPSPVFSDLFAELQVICARRVRPAAVERLRARIASPFRRVRLDSSVSVLERSRAILEHQPYDHFALWSAITLLSREDARSPELDGLFERACLVAPEDVPPERRPPRLAPFLPA